MNLKAIKIGKAHEPYTSLVKTYPKRLKPFCPMELVYLKDNPALVKYLEKAKGAFILLCDERGSRPDSVLFSKYLLEKLSFHQQVLIVVGDAYGFSEEIREKAHGLICLSNFVLANDIAWLVLNEQLYRAFMIKNGHAYHHGDS